MALRFSPAQPILRWMHRHDLAVLAYHGVGDPEAFEAQLRYLVRHTRPVSLDGLLDVLRSGRSLRPRSVLLTFDDGEVSVLDQGLPLMRDYGVPGVAFVCPGVLDSDEPLWVDEYRELKRSGATLPAWPGGVSTRAWAYLTRAPDTERRAILDSLRATLPEGTALPRKRQLRSEGLLRLEHGGVTIGNHTMTHPFLNRCDTATIEWEIEEAHLRLTRALGHEPPVFAAPNGARDDRVDRQVAKIGYRLAFGYDQRLSRWPPPDLLNVSRLGGNASDSVHRLAVGLSGLHAPLWHANSRLDERRAAPGPDQPRAEVPLGG